MSQTLKEELKIRVLESSKQQMQNRTKQREEAIAQRIVQALQAQEVSSPSKKAELEASDTQQFSELEFFYSTPLGFTIQTQPKTYQNVQAKVESQKSNGKLEQQFNLNIISQQPHQISNINQQSQAEKPQNLIQIEPQLSNQNFDQQLESSNENLSLQSEIPSVNLQQKSQLQPEQERFNTNLSIIDNSLTPGIQQNQFGTQELSFTDSKKIQNPLLLQRKFNIIEIKENYNQYQDQKSNIQAKLNQLSQSVNEFSLKQFNLEQKQGYFDFQKIIEILKITKLKVLIIDNTKINYLIIQNNKKLWENIHQMNYYNKTNLQRKSFITLKNKIEELKQWQDKNLLQFFTESHQITKSIPFANQTRKISLGFSKEQNFNNLASTILMKKFQQIIDFYQKQSQTQKKVFKQQQFNTKEKFFQKNSKSLSIEIPNNDTIVENDTKIQTSILQRLRNSIESNSSIINKTFIIDQGKINLDSKQQKILKMTPLKPNYVNNLIGEETQHREREKILKIKRNQNQMKLKYNGNIQQQKSNKDTCIFLQGLKISGHAKSKITKNYQIESRIINKFDPEETLNERFESINRQNKREEKAKKEYNENLRQERIRLQESQFDDSFKNIQINETQLSQQPIHDTLNEEVEQYSIKDYYLSLILTNIQSQQNIEGQPENYLTENYNPIVFCYYVPRILENYNHVQYVNSLPEDHGTSCFSYYIPQITELQYPLNNENTDNFQQNLNNNYQNMNKECQYQSFDNQYPCIIQDPLTNNQTQSNIEYQSQTINNLHQANSNNQNTNNIQLNTINFDNNHSQINYYPISFHHNPSQSYQNLNQNGFGENTSQFHQQIDSVVQNQTSQNQNILSFNYNQNNSSHVKQNINQISGPINQYNPSSLNLNPSPLNQFTNQFNLQTNTFNQNNLSQENQNTTPLNQIRGPINQNNPNSFSLNPNPSNQFTNHFNQQINQNNLTQVNQNITPVNQVSALINQNNPSSFSLNPNLSNQFTNQFNQQINQNNLSSINQDISPGNQIKLNGPLNYNNSSSVSLNPYSIHQFQNQFNEPTNIVNTNNRNKLKLSALSSQNTSQLEQQINFNLHQQNPNSINLSPFSTPVRQQTINFNQINKDINSNLNSFNLNNSINSTSTSLDQCSNVFMSYASRFQQNQMSSNQDLRQFKNMIVEPLNNNCTNNNFQVEEVEMQQNNQQIEAGTKSTKSSLIQNSQKQIKI